MSRKEKMKEFNRSNILDTAKKLFVENGFAQTTMDDIAKEADYSKSTIYVYFKSKDEIYSNIILENMTLLKETLEQAIKNNRTVKATFFDICNAHVAFQTENPLFFDSMINGNLEESLDEAMYQKMLNMNNEINKILADFLKSGIEKQQIRSDVDIKQTAFALWSSICGIILVSYNKKSYIDYLNVNRADYLTHSFNILLNSILP